MEASSRVFGCDLYPAELRLAAGASLIACAVQLQAAVAFIVVGETARTANFELGGYSRATTPQPAATNDVIYFNDVTACGTSTAVSVPCMLSHLDRAHFDVDEAGRYTDLLDSGFDVRANNASFKASALA